MNRLHQRCLDLLADRATNDLNDATRLELQTILRRHPEWRDEGYEGTVAALDLAMVPEAMSMPKSLRQRLGRAAQRWIEHRNDA